MSRRRRDHEKRQLELFVILFADPPHYVDMIPVQLEYTAPAGCPTQTEFVTSVARRGGDFARPGPKTEARSLVVTLRREGSQHLGSLALRLDDTTTDARELRGETCAEVAEALAVVAALALRGPSDSAATGTESPAPVPPAAAAQRREGTLPAAVSKPAPQDGDTRLRVVGLWGNEVVPVAAGPLQVNRSLSVALSGGVVLGAIPGVVLPRYDLSLTRANFITTPQGDSFLVGNVFGVRWSVLGLATHRSGSYSTDVYGLRAGVRSCSSLTYDPHGFVALLCGSVSVGLTKLETKDLETDFEQSKEVGQGAAGLELDARYHLGRHLYLSGTVAGEMWLGELSAQRADGSELFRSRLFNAGAALGIGVTF